MFTRGKHRFLCIILLVCITSSGIVVQATFVPQRFGCSPIPTDSIIRQGVSQIRSFQLGRHAAAFQLMLLEAFFTTNPYIDHASRIQTSITLKFIDGSYTVLIDPFALSISPQNSSPISFVHYTDGFQNNSSAILLNPEEYVYGHHQCQQIISLLLRHHYHITYLANDAVTISYLRQNLSADVIFMNTHAGFFDTDGDHQADAVVIASGENWTNDTESRYSFEYQHHMIVKGMIGDKSIIAFTPAFIEYYYPPGTFPHSLVYMATCFATYDSSMAEAFLQAGASAYLGWSWNSVFWINSRTSIQSFRLLSNGWTVQQVCNLIRYGGIMNRLFHSKLLFYGDGQYQIPL